MSALFSYFCLHVADVLCECLETILSQTCLHSILHIVSLFACLSCLFNGKNTLGESFHFSITEVVTCKDKNRTKPTSVYGRHVTIKAAQGRNTV